MRTQMLLSGLRQTSVEYVLVVSGSGVVSCARVVSSVVVSGGDVTGGGVSVEGVDEGVVGSCVVTGVVSAGRGGGVVVGSSLAV